MDDEGLNVSGLNVFVLVGRLRVATGSPSSQLPSSASSCPTATRWKKAALEAASRERSNARRNISQVNMLVENVQVKSLLNV